MSPTQLPVSQDEAEHFRVKPLTEIIKQQIYALMCFGCFQTCITKTTFKKKARFQSRINTKHKPSLETNAGFCSIWICRSITCDFLFFSAIATVSSISVEYSCLTSTATVSWNAVFGATSYRAAITDGQGRSLNCTSTDATCQISNLVCGERYTIRITAIANCESTSDGSYVFETGKDVLSQRSHSHLIQSSGG